MNTLVCIVGMCGAGKSLVADALVAKGYGFVRFGQLTLDIVKERGMIVCEASEREVRESLRREHGMGAYATLNIPKFEKLLIQGSVVGDGLYSWDEYKILRKHFGKSMIVLCVYAPPYLRYERISKRKSGPEDTDLRHRSFTLEEAHKRDFAEIENLAKGGPIAMADYTLVNTGTPAELYAQLDKVLALCKR
jgi:dephospho-CoA kinase